MDNHAGFNTADDALTFIKGGNATFTLVSEKTGTRYTYKVRQKKEDEGSKTPFFVQVLSGPDNTADFDYLGFIKADGESALIAGHKGKPSAPSFKAFSWAWAHLNRGDIPEQLSIYHDGKCCRCGRTLTVPASVESGIGPECAKKEV